MNWDEQERLHQEIVQKKALEVVSSSDEEDLDESSFGRPKTAFGHRGQKRSSSLKNGVCQHQMIVKKRCQEMVLKWEESESSSKEPDGSYFGTDSADYILSDFALGPKQEDEVEGTNQQKVTVAELFGKHPVKTTDYILSDFALGPKEEADWNEVEGAHQHEVTVGKKTCQELELDGSYFGKCHVKTADYILSDFALEPEQGGSCSDWEIKSGVESTHQLSNKKRCHRRSTKRTLRRSEEIYRTAATVLLPSDPLTSQLNQDECSC